MMDKIRRAVFKLIGYPSDVQSLMNKLDHVDSEQVVIYPIGEFPFAVKTKNGDMEPLIFPTELERLAFALGLSKGVEMLGGTTGFMTQDQVDSYEEMEKFSTVRGDPKKVN